ncbi:hypothetical protein J6P59_06600 [bacterium]|nr:hypothetical protein [bacterium]
MDGNQQLITYNHITYIGSDIGGYMASGISQEASGLTQQNNEIGYVPGFVTVEMDLCGV